MIIYQKDLERGVRCCGPEGCGEHRPVFQGFRRFCIGAECAAWEFGPIPVRAYQPFTGERPESEPERPRYLNSSWEWHDEECVWMEPAKEADSRRAGWCGLLARRSES